MSRYCSLVMFGLLASAGPLHAQPANQDLPPPSVLAPSTADNPADQTEDVKVSDRWIYEVRDEITGEVKATITNIVTDATKSEINVGSSASGHPNSGYAPTIVSGTSRTTAPGGTPPTTAPAFDCRSRSEKHGPIRARPSIRLQD
jgi:hypothetical protein